MSRSALVAELTVRVLLLVAAVLVTVGVGMVFPPAGWMVAGVLLAGWVWVAFIEGAS